MTVAEAGALDGTVMLILQHHTRLKFAGSIPRGGGGLVEGRRWRGLTVGEF
jgi:hypothetical protein